MERVHMNHMRDLIYRVRSGQSDRGIAKDLGLSRDTVLTADMFDSDSGLSV
jgi:hypothetical protein